MSKISKRQAIIRDKITKNKLYEFTEAIKCLQSLPALKFKQSVEIHVVLGIDPKKSDQVVRSATVLPNGTGKTVRVAVFTTGSNVDKAKQAGADVVGMNDLMKSMQDGDLSYDVVIASPDAMGIVGRLGPLLGPRGLMPNPKLGTVSQDVATAVQKAKAGQVRYRNDKGGIIHCAIGKEDFAAPDLKKNVETLLSDIKKIKPSTSKGVYIRKIFLSTTMGPGLEIDKSSLSF